MIAIEGLGKSFGRLRAVHEVWFTLNRGETIALIGPNGSGKTTTLKMILGLVRPNAGRVLFEGAPLTAAARARIGYLPQNHGFGDGVRAAELLRFYADVRGLPGLDVDATLQRVGLLDAAGREVSRFSGGMKQRLGIAIALLGDPVALVLDEPTAALDPTGALQLRELLAQIQGEGRSLLVSSHDLAEVEALADRLAIFAEGRLIAIGSRTELSEQLEIASTDAVSIYRAATGLKKVA